MELPPPSLELRRLTRWLGRRSLGAGALGFLEPPLERGASGFHSGSQQRPAAQLINGEADGI